MHPDAVVVSHVTARCSHLHCGQARLGCLMSKLIAVTYIVTRLNQSLIAVNYMVSRHNWGVPFITAESALQSPTWCLHTIGVPFVTVDSALQSLTWCPDTIGFTLQVEQCQATAYYNMQNVQLLCSG